MKVILCCFQPRESWVPATLQTHRFLRLSSDEQKFSLNSMLQINSSQKSPFDKFPDKLSFLTLMLLTWSK